MIYIASQNFLNLFQNFKFFIFLLLFIFCHKPTFTFLNFINHLLTINYCTFAIFIFMVSISTCIDKKFYTG